MQGIANMYKGGNYNEKHRNNNNKDTSAFIFYGQRTMFYRFEEELINQFEEKGIRYISDRIEINNRLREPERPAPRPVIRGENAQLRAANEAMDKSEYQIKLASHIKDVKKMDEDFFKAIALIRKMVSSDIQRKIDNIKHTNEFARISTYQKYQMVMAMIVHDHGPKGEDTANVWRNKLNTLSGDGPDGFKDLLVKYHQYVTYLEKTPRLDENRNPIVNDDPTVSTYRPSNSELRGYLKRALQKTTKDRFNLYYTKLMEEENDEIHPNRIEKKIQELIDSGADNKNYKNNNNNNNNNTRYNNSYGNTYVDMYEQEYNEEQEYNQYNKNEEFDEEYNEYNNNSSSSMSSMYNKTNTGKYNNNYHNNNNNYYNNNNNKKNGKPIECLNCLSPDHYAPQCKSRKCGVCGEVFTTYVERSVHYIQLHKNSSNNINNKKNQQNNTPNSNNFNIVNNHNAKRKFDENREYINNQKRIKFNENKNNRNFHNNNNHNNNNNNNKNKYPLRSYMSSSNNNEFENEDDYEYEYDEDNHQDDEHK